MQVTKEQLDAYVSDKPYHMVVMYADWCGHCKSMIKDLGSKFKQYDTLTFLESANVEDDLLDYFPHIHIYENNKRRDGSMKDLYNLLQIN